MVFAEQYEELTKLDEKIKQQDQRITNLCTNVKRQTLLDVPGVGPMTTSMIAADIGEGKATPAVVIMQPDRRTRSSIVAGGVFRDQ